MLNENEQAQDPDRPTDRTQVRDAPAVPPGSASTQHTPAQRPTLVDEMREANSQLVRGTIRAQEAQERADLRVEGLDAIVWEMDAGTGQFTFVSHRAEQILGYPIERWLEANFWISMIHPDDRKRVVSSSNAAMATRRDYQLEYRAVASDGHLVWFAHIVRLILTPAQPMKIFGIMVDITAQKRLEEKLQRVISDHEALEERLRDKLEELERFHEIVVGRELKMIRLEKEMEQLMSELEKLKAERGSSGK